MTAHTVPLDVIDALACGGGETGGVLRSAERSKRLLLLHQLMATARARVPNMVVEGNLDGTYAALVEAHRRARRAVDEVLLQPHVGAWATRCLRDLLTHGEVAAGDLGHLGAVAAVAVRRAGRSVDVTAHLRDDGSLMLPTHGLARLPVAGGWCRLRSPAGASGLEILAADRRLDLQLGTPATPSGWDGSAGSAPTWLPLRRLRSIAGGLAVEVFLDDVDPFRRCADLPFTGRLGPDVVADWQAKLDGAWSLLVEHHRPQAEAIADSLRACVPLHPTDEDPELSATSREAPGAVAMTPPRSSMAIALALVHEWRHDTLYRLADLVPLTGTHRERRFYSPWRRDPRPAWGLFHGAYAFLGLTEFWDVQRRHRSEGQGNELETSFEFALSRHQVATAVEDLRAFGSLTPTGMRLVEGMRRRLAVLRRRRVPAEVGSLAEAACHDHAASWRLRNVRPDPDQVETWAEAWSSARPFPRLGEPRGMVVDGNGPMPSGARLALIRRRIADAGRPADTRDDTRGDVRLAQGDVAGAVDAYRTQIRRDPEDLASWAGLVLARRLESSQATWVLTTFPEVARAVHRVACDRGGDVPDPEEIAVWLGRGLSRARRG